MGVCDLPVVSTVCDKAGDAAGSLVTAPFDWLAEGMGNAAEWMFTSVWSVFDTTTSVDITSDAYMKVYNILDRKSVGEGKSVAVRVDLGGRRHIKKKKN